VGLNELGMGDGASGVKLKVPMCASDELGIVIAAISAIEAGKVEITRWRPSRPMAFNDGYDSSEEQVDSRYVNSGRRLRRVKSSARAPPIVTEVEKVPWTYTPALSQGSDVDRRAARVISPNRFEEAMRNLEATLVDYQVPYVSPGIEVVNGTEGPVGFVMSGESSVDMGTVESPGGSAVCELPVSVCEKLNMGVALEAVEFLDTLSVVREDMDRFVFSKLFDCFSGPWDSFLNTLMLEENVLLIKRKGAYVDTYAIVQRLQNRFSVELMNALKRSNLLKRRFFKVFLRNPSTEKLMMEIRNGSFSGIAQTDGFISRVKYLKDLLDQVLLVADRCGVFLPNHITEAQRALPLRGVAPLGVLGVDYIPPKGVVQNALQNSVRWYSPRGSGL